MRTFSRLWRVLLVVVLVGVVAPRPAAAQDEGEDERDTIVVLTGRAEVREGEAVDNVVIADGPAVVAGTVHDSVVAFNGDVLVTGTVEDQVVAFNGRVTVRGDGVVEGDVVSRRRPVEEAGGRIEGSWERWNARAWNGLSGFVAWIVLWVATSVSTLVLGALLALLAPRAAWAVDDARRAAIGPVIGWGLLLTIGLPLVAVLALLTVVALPLGLAVLLALALVYGIGYTTAAWLLGRAILARSHPFLSFVVGWAILRVVALVPVLGALVGFAAVVVGLGALAVAGYRARRRVGPPVEPRPAPQAAPVAGSPDVPGSRDAPGPRDAPA
jgi:hypothetical protein